MRHGIQLASESTFAAVAGLGSAWAYEPKLDGHRLIVSRDGCWTRNGATLRLEAIQAACPAGAVLDCELVVAGRSTAGRVQAARRKGALGTLRVVAFDVLAMDGCAVVELPQRERRAVLESLVLCGPLSMVASFCDAETAMDASQEGIIAKRGDAPYRAERVTCWRKAKWQYHYDREWRDARGVRRSPRVDYLHDEVDWAAVESGFITVSRTLSRQYH